VTQEGSQQLGNLNEIMDSPSTVSEANPLATSAMHATFPQGLAGRPVAVTSGLMNQNQLTRSFGDFYNELKLQLRVLNQGDVASLVMLLAYLMSK
jgi:hypothetical protein